MTAEDRRFPCPACGANLRFAPGGDKLLCDFCGHEESLENDAAPTPLREIRLEEGLKGIGDAELEDTRITHCDTCGADIELSDDTQATECPFCASPVVVQTNRHIKPRGVLPFILSEPEAHDAMNTWLGRLWFAPNGLKTYARQGRKLDGVYVPFWTFDAATTTRYTGRRGIVHTTRRRVQRGGKTETETVRKVIWTPVSGRVHRFFDDVLVLASKALPKTFTDALPPWDLTQLEPYAPDYLAGFRAEVYTIGLEEALPDARRQMDAQIARDIRFDIGGDRQQISSASTELSRQTFKHILLPVWVAAYKYRGKSYRFVVNGQTGRVRGERPWSVWKIAVAVVLGAIVLAAAFALGVTLDQTQIN
ncbi:MAG: primosomal protein N' (replication factor Y) - superfamily II helicase [Pseudomonadota bacterium]